MTPTYPVHTKGAILITGASTGIGLHAAQHLSALGFRVYAGVRSSQAAEQVKQAGGEFFFGRRGKNVQRIVGVEYFEHLFDLFYVVGSRT